MKEFYSKSNRMSALIFEATRKVTLKIIQVHAPTSLSSDEDIESFYGGMMERVEYVSNDG